MVVEEHWYHITTYNLFSEILYTVSKQKLTLISQKFFNQFQPTWTCIDIIISSNTRIFQEISTIENKKRQTFTFESTKTTHKLSGPHPPYQLLREGNSWKFLKWKIWYKSIYSSVLRETLLLYASNFASQCSGGMCRRHFGMANWNEFLVKTGELWLGNGSLRRIILSSAVLHSDFSNVI